MNQQAKTLSEKIANSILLIVIVSVMLLGIYAVFIAPKLWLNKAEIDFQHTVNQMGKPVGYFTKKQCAHLQFITCQQMNDKQIEIIYWWSKGLDVNIIVGFDANHQVKDKMIVNNEQLSLE